MSYYFLTILLWNHLKSIIISTSFSQLHHHLGDTFSQILTASSTLFLSLKHHHVHFFIASTSISVGLFLRSHHPSSYYFTYYLQFASPSSSRIIFRASPCPSRIISSHSQEHLEGITISRKASLSPVDLLFYSIIFHRGFVPNPQLKMTRGNPAMMCHHFGFAKPPAARGFAPWNPTNFRKVGQTLRGPFQGDLFETTRV